tara:strand:- start:22 stop:303 length:282 start_codon:yes stop_codon:yes gene_type:complete
MIRYCVYQTSIQDYDLVTIIGFKDSLKEECIGNLVPKNSRLIFEVSYYDLDTINTVKKEMDCAVDMLNQGIMNPTSLENLFQDAEEFKFYRLH